MYGARDERMDAISFSFNAGLDHATMCPYQCAYDTNSSVFFLVATRRILSTLRRILVLHSDARQGVADHPV